MKARNLFLAVLSILVLLAAPINVFAITYDVNRSFSDSNGIASLVGTLDIAAGNYTIMNESASPFTDVDLTLTVTSISGIFSYNLVNALTGIIRNNGQFLITATATDLIFNTAGGDGANPADLVFSDNTLPYSNNRYVIGSNGNPSFEVAYTNTGDVLGNVTFPLVFGIVSMSVPEPTTMLLLGLGLLGLAGIRRKVK